MSVERIHATLATLKPAVGREIMGVGRGSPIKVIDLDVLQQASDALKAAWMPGAEDQVGLWLDRACARVKQAGS